MTNWVNPSTRVGGVEQIVVAERRVVPEVDDAPYDDEQYVRINGEWVPVTTPPPVPDTLAPKPPTGLSAVGAISVDGTRADYTLSWTAPTENTDSSPLDDLAYYVIRWRYAIGGAFQSFVVNDTQYRLFNLVLGSDIEWQVLARDTSGNDSTWAVKTTAGLTDTDGPLQPSMPMLSSRLGTIAVAWDGLIAGAAPPADFDHLEIYISDTTGGPWSYVDRLSGAGQRVVLNVLVGQTRFFSFIAYDTSGNASPRSVENSIEVTGVVGPDIEANSITSNEIDAGYVYTGSLIANQIEGGTILADINIAGSFSTALSGQRSVMDGFGIRQFGPDGVSVITELPNSGNPRFSGVVNAFGLIVNGGLEFRGQNNLFAMGSVVTMATKTSGSTISPSITPNYDTIVADWNSYLWNAQGVHRETDGAIATFLQNFYGYSGIRHGSYMYNYPEIQPATGNKRSTRDAYAGTMIRTTGGQRWVQYAARYVAGGTSPDVGFEVLDLAPMTGSVPPTIKTTTSGGTPTDWFTGYRLGRCFSPPGQSALENNFAFLKFNSYLTGYPITLRRYACTDTSVVQQGSDLVVNHPENGQSQQSAIRGVTYGSSSKMSFPGADQNIWIVHTVSKNYVWSAAGVRLPEFDYPSSAQNDIAWTVGSTAAGVNGFDHFESGSSMQVSRYSNIHWVSPDVPTWWACYTWRDSVGVTHESDMSALNSTTMQKRMRFTLTAPNLPDPAAGAGTVPQPDDVNGVNFYMGRKSTQPTRTEMWKQTVQPADGVVTATYNTMPQFSGTSNPPNSTNFPSQAASKFQSSAVGADGLPKVLITGDGFLHGETLDVSGAGASSLQGKAFEQLYYSIRAQSMFQGGGNVTMSTINELGWSARFIGISLGRSANSAAGGYFQIDQPPAGTVVPGYGGATSKTVTAAGIPLNPWDALWYELPYGSPKDSVPGNFRITNYTGDFVVPNNWILIAIRNGDANVTYVNNGARIPAGGRSVNGGASITTYNPGYGTGFTYASSATADAPRCVAYDKWVYFTARVKRTSGTGVIACTISNSAWWPDTTVNRCFLTALGMNGGTTLGPTYRCEIDETNGNVSLTEYTGGPAWGTGTWISIFGTYPRV